MLEKIKKALKWFYHSYIWIALVVFVLDITSKWIVQNYAVNHNLSDGSTLVSVIPNFFEIKISHNLGAAFSIGSGGSVGMRIVWIAISVIMSIAIGFYYFKSFKKINLATKVALTMMLGGAVGNMIDRCLYWNNIVGFDGVIDWLSFTFGTYEFATFNIADAALVVGVIILIIVLIYDAILDSKRKAEAGEYKYSPKELEEMKKQKELEEENKETEASNE